MVSNVIPEVNKIAILRSTSLGDFIFGLPALDALRNTYPQAEIVYLGNEWMCNFIPGRLQSVDRCEIVPQAEGVLIEYGKEIDPAAQEAFFERMQAERFDLAVQMLGGGCYTNPFTLHLKARVTIGAKSEDAIPLDRWIPYIYLISTSNQLGINLEMLLDDRIPGKSFAKIFSLIGIASTLFWISQKLLHSGSHPIFIVRLDRQYDLILFERGDGRIITSHNFTTGQSGFFRSSELRSRLRHTQRKSIWRNAHLSNSQLYIGHKFAGQ